MDPRNHRCGNVIDKVDYVVHNRLVELDCQVHSLSGTMMIRPPEPNGHLTAKGRAMRDRIVASAADLIFARGARETTLDEVRFAVGASKSQLYHYFADKDELLRAVIDRQGDRIIEAQQPELGAMNSFESLRRWRDKLIQLSDTHGRIGGCPIGSLANELAGHSEEHRRALAAHFDHWAGLIEAGLSRMQASGRLDPSLDPKSLSLTILTAVQGGLLLAKLHRSSKALGAALDEIISSLEDDAKNPVARSQHPARLKSERKA